MEQMTTVVAEKGAMGLWIERKFELPLSLVWMAHTEAHLIEAWMSHAHSQLRMVSMDCRRHGAWEFERTDPQGLVHLRAHGVYHDVLPEQQIIRSFEMLDAPFGVQLELYLFEAIEPETSRLRLQMVFQSTEQRDLMLQRGMVMGLGMAHNRLQEILESKR